MIRVPDTSVQKSHEDEILFEETAIDDLQHLSQALLDSSGVGGLIRDAGVHGDFTAEQQAAIDKEIEAFATERGWAARDPMLLSLSITLARWVAAGKITAVDDQDAHDFLEDRYLKRAGDYHGFRTTKPTPDDVILVAQALKNDPVYWAAMQYTAEHDHEDEDYRKKVLRPIEERVRFKCGLQNRGAVVFFATIILLEVAKGKFSNLDHPEVKKYLQTKKNDIRIEADS